MHDSQAITGDKIFNRRRIFKVTVREAGFILKGAVAAVGKCLINSVSLNFIESTLKSTFMTSEQ